MSEETVEEFLKRKSVTPENINDSFVGYVVSYKNALIAVEKTKLETAEKIFEDFDLWFKKWKGVFGYLSLDHESYTKIKTKYLKQDTKVKK